MWEAYRDIAKTYFPECIVAIDSFHVIKHLYSNFERLRIDLMNQCAYGSNAYYLLKKWSWLLIADNVNLDNERVNWRENSASVGHATKPEIKH